MTGPAPCDRIDIVVPPYQNLNAALGQLAGVEVGLVQSQSIGYEGIAALLPAGVPLANAAGVHETSTAELAVGLAIASLRRLDQFARDTATATLHTRDGRVLSAQANVAIPATDLDAQWQRLHAKARAIAEPVIGAARFERLAQAVAALPTSPHLHSLIEAIQ